MWGVWYRDHMDIGVSYIKYYSLACSHQRDASVSWHDEDWSPVRLESTLSHTYQTLQTMATLQPHAFYLGKRKWTLSFPNSVVSVSDGTPKGCSQTIWCILCLNDRNLWNLPFPGVRSELGNGQIYYSSFSLSVNLNKHCSYVLTEERGLFTLNFFLFF